MSKIVSYKNFSVFVTIILLVSCQTYESVSFKPEKVLSDLQKKRIQPMSQGTLSFSDAAKLMKQNNLRLKRLLQAYKGYQAVSELNTPMPNPELEFGPAFGTGLSEKSASSTQPFIGLGFSIPLGPRLRRSDELNHLNALKAYNACFPRLAYLPL